MSDFSKKFRLVSLGLSITLFSFLFASTAFSQDDDDGVIISDGSNYGFEVRRDKILEGEILKSNANVTSVDACAKMCSETEVCRSFTFVVGANSCEFKGNNTFASSIYSGYVSGISTALRDYVRTTNKKVKHSLVQLVGGINSEAACAAHCSSYGGAGCKAYSARPFADSDFMCELSDSEELRPLTESEANLSITSGVAKKLLDYAIHDNRILQGAIVERRPGVESLNDCAAACASDGRCNSFTFVPSKQSCEFKESHTFIDKSYQGYVSGVHKDFGMYVQGVYVVPKGETPRPNAVMAIEAALLQVQEHYRRELGVTFELDIIASVPIDEPSTVFQATEETIVKCETPGTLLATTQFGANFTQRRNIMVFVVEGLDNPTGAWGCGNIVVIENEYWNHVYNNFEDVNSLLTNGKLPAWSHELGHAFGLNHWDVTRKCLENIKNELGPDGAAIMWQQEKKSNLFDYYFSDWEKKILKGEKSSRCYKPWSLWGQTRPAAQYFLRKRN